MKHQEIIEKFHNEGEFDGHCYILYLGHEFWGILEDKRNDAYTDILSAYLNPDGNELSLLISSPDDSDQTFATLGEFPFSIQKQIINQIKS